jgi:maltose alpha-D-glucosyltransferase/alpha-amylase
VLGDLVPNHTSDQHSWFRKARTRESPLHDVYVWSKKRPANWRSGVVFPGVQRSTWTYDRESREYYFHRFYEFQPDVNMDNPRVREEVRQMMGLWLQLGSSACTSSIWKSSATSCSGGSAMRSCSARRT